MSKFDIDFINLQKDSIDDLKNYLSNKRSENNDQREIEVKALLQTVKKDKDKALLELTKRFDGAELKELRVTEQEVEEAYKNVDSTYLPLLQRAKKRIYDYHSKQVKQSWMTTESGAMTGQIVRPLERVGVYVPGGKAFYPSSVLMNVLPAQVAGVEQIVMVTPPDQEGNINPYVLVAANEVGITEMYKLGGVQAVGALAYGTETVEKVDKIVGPGNIYVALAKKAVYGEVDIDSVAGPSEILVYGDDTANPAYVAADLLSQAEHDELASAVFVTTNQELMAKVEDAIEEQLKTLSREKIIRESLKNNGAFILVKDQKQGIDAINTIATEHLVLSVAEPMAMMTEIKHAGAIFMGHYTPESLGDYMAGPNHVLPTGGTARFASPLGVDDFIKRSSILSFSKEALFNLGEDVMAFAKMESLTAHANAVRVRMES